MDMIELGKKYAEENNIVKNLLANRFSRKFRKLDDIHIIIDEYIGDNRVVTHYFIKNYYQ